jgi:hypothetical protein
MESSQFWANSRSEMGGIAKNVGVTFTSGDLLFYIAYEGIWLSSFVHIKGQGLVLIGCPMTARVNWSKEI